MSDSGAYVAYYVRECTSAMSSNGKPYNILQLVDSELVQKQCYLWDCTDRMTDHVIVLFNGLPEPNAKGFIGFDESRIAGDLGCFQKDAKLQSQYPAWACFVNPVPSYEKFAGVLRSLLSAWLPQADESGAVRAPETSREKMVALLFEKLPGLYESYSTMPAAKRFHDNWAGGLANHTYQILTFIHGLRKWFPWNVDLFVLTFAALYHDYGKLFEYNSDTFEYEEDLMLRPHSVQSAEVFVQEYGSMLSKVLLDRIVHCIYSHHGRKEWGAPCDPATIEAIILSQLDQLAAWGQSIFSVPNLEFCQALSRRVVNTPCPEE